MRRRLQHPAFRPDSATAGVAGSGDGIRRPAQVLLLEPRVIGRNEIRRRELKAQEGVAENDDTLLGEPGADGMDRAELRLQPVEPADLTLGDARCVDRRHTWPAPEAAMGAASPS